MVPVKQRVQQRQQRHITLMLTFEGGKERIFLSSFVKHLFFCPPSFLFSVSEMFFFYCNPVLLLNQLLLYAAVKHFVETSKYGMCRISNSESL